MASQAPAGFPTVSVVIPCRNEEKYIRRCVESVLENDYPADLLQVVVCDGRSDDRTREIVGELSQSNDRVILVDNPQRTTPFALNLGIEATPAEVVIILGGHAEVYPDFVSENVRILQEHPDVGCAGGIIENVHENRTAAIVGMAMASSFGVGNARFRTGGKEGYVDTVAFGAYRREVFDKVGLFDTDLARNQDDEFNFRVLKGGFKIWYAPGIRSKYFVRASYKKLFRQYFQYGYWKVFVNRKHKAVTSVRQLAPLGLVLFLIWAVLTGWIHPWLALGYVGVFGLYLLLATLSAFRAGNNADDVPGVLFTFWVLHLGYGLGYLKGIVRFLIFNRGLQTQDAKLTR